MGPPNAGGRRITVSSASSTPAAGLPPAGIRSRLGPIGVAVQMLFGWSFTFAYAILTMALSMLTLGRLYVWLTPAMLRLWSRVMLFIQRVDVIVEGEQHVAGRAMRVVVFNHASLLDAMLVTAVYPTGGVPVIKREVLRIPLVGWALWAMRFLLIDRGRTAKAKQRLVRLTDRMARDRLTVVIAPEGTRGASGELLPFKKGAFHIAQASGAPIVPMLIDGAHTVHPLGSPISHPGLARIRFLPPVPTAGLRPEDIDALAERIRKIMLDGLAEMRHAG